MEKILIVSCEGLGNGGVQSVIMNIVRNLHGKYIFDVLLFTKEKRFYDDEFLSYGGKIIRVPFYEGKLALRRKIDYYVRFSRLKRHIKKQIAINGPYKAIHCNNGFESSICLSVAKKQNIPIRICHAHTIVEKTNFMRKIINFIYYKSIIKNATNLVGCTDECCLSFFGKNNEYNVVFNPYDETKYFYCPKEDYKHDSIVLTQVGAFSTVKNQMFSVEMFEKILRDYPNSKLYLIGFDLDGTRNKLQTAINEKNLKNSVYLLEHNVDINHYLSISDAFILPSLCEGFGIVLLEAQAIGLKCYVSTNVPKAADVGGCTFLQLNNGEELWANTIKNDYLKKELSHKKYDVSKFSKEKFVNKIDELYRGK